MYSPFAFIQMYNDTPTTTASWSRNLCGMEIAQIYFIENRLK